jgi:alpha-L-fucosidase
LNIYYGSVGGNGQFLLNIPPDRRGLFHENDVARLKQFGDVLRTTFVRDLAAGAKMTVEVAGGSSVGDIATLLDEDPDTFWTTTDGAGSAVITAMLPAAVRANCLMLQEHIASGQRVEAFEVELLVDGKWKKAVSGTVIGYKRLVRFDDATLSGIRVHLKKFRLRPTIAGLSLYLAPAVLSGPKFLRDINGTVTIKASTGTSVRFTLDGSVPEDGSKLYTDPIPMPRGGLIIARAFPLTPGKRAVDGKSVVTRVEYGPAKAKWRIFSCDSQDAAGGKAEHAIDDDPKTIWETRFRDGFDPKPHYIAVDLGETMDVRGFTYTPRQDQWDSGIVLRARFEVSRDGKEWTVVSDNVDFDNVVNSRQQQVVRIEKPVPARYFRMTALRTVNDSDQTSAADISVLVK